jgi:hypothetical protein
MNNGLPASINQNRINYIPTAVATALITAISLILVAAIDGLFATSKAENEAKLKAEERFIPKTGKSGS